MAPTAHWDSDGSAKEAATSSKEKWNKSDDSLGTPSTPPPAYGSIVASTTSWDAIRAGEVFTLETETRECARQQKERQTRQQRLGSILVPVGFLCLLLCDILALVLAVEAEKRLSVTLESNPGYLSFVTVFAVTGELIVLLVVLPCLIPCHVPDAVVMGIVCLVCVDAFTNGAMLIAAAKVNLDGGACSGHRRRAGSCLSGLELGLAAGAFRVMLLPIGCVMLTGYLVGREAKKGNKSQTQNGRPGEA
ncbi:hypothetical protein Cob_v010685 [Colletotrichum orbiculare MAFF 240422]|uniref:Uncharacterized protein n=1 Tax=Colletotrichum orbiculare (strain 104-T / ATCC 96160 / CBS 514.97 / LARS 414 / MAFF 240422) TaxID=1213857 RepID=N4VU92_COLOR|nr:hypothetical protein Cob_v010685 [Colletotrichum orbiculare MAFF 240422]